MNSLDKAQGDAIAVAVKQMRENGWAVLVYRGTNRHVLVLSKGSEVIYLGEAKDG